MIYTTEILLQTYSKYKNPLDKIKRECQKGNLFRLNRGLYEDSKNIEPIYLAAHIHSPSYISFEKALEIYGLIPERVYAITSATLLEHKNKTYQNYFGRYEFSDVPEKIFPEGLELIKDNCGYSCRIATREKAICDMLYKWPPVKSIKAFKELLFEDKRIDEDEFALCDMEKLIELASLYKKSNLRLLIKLVKKDYLHH